MTTLSRSPREIDSKGRTIRELLAGRKYSIDYYQREYKWQQEQVTELINDLASKFLESHRRFIAERGFPFRAHAEFKNMDLDARQNLYRQLAERIWDPERLAQEVAL